MCITLVIYKISHPTTRKIWSEGKAQEQAERKRGGAQEAELRKRPESSVVAIFSPMPLF
jgi:hypothetical protein